MNHTIQDNLQNIMQGYHKAYHNESCSKSSSIGQYFTQITQILVEAAPLKRDAGFHINWSIGKGGWARVPWLAVFHQDETHTTQKGVYVIYLFREVMQGIYLTLNQGVTNSLDTHETGEKRYHKLHSKADQIRDRVPELEKQGFQLDNKIDLKATSALGKSYSHSTIAHKYYPLGELPDDKTLLSDLDAALGAYQKYLKTL